MTPNALILCLALTLTTQEPARVSPSIHTLRGSLVIAGGGALPKEIRARFLELAGSAKARLVIVPTASAHADSDPERFLAPWREFDLESLDLLHTRERERADDEAFAAVLERASGVWISGGSQSRILETYGGTRVEKALQALLDRGGVIGGTSAGAACLSRVMIASGNPVPKIATGFDFFPHAIIDQHFLKRDRFDRLIRAVSQHEDRVGYGIDEGTALVVDGESLEVLGESYVIAYTTAQGTSQPQSVRVLRPGRKHDWREWVPKRRRPR